MVCSFKFLYNDSENFVQYNPNLLTINSKIINIPPLGLSLNYLQIYTPDITGLFKLILIFESTEMIVENNVANYLNYSKKEFVVKSLTISNKSEKENDVLFELSDKFSVYSHRSLIQKKVPQSLFFQDNLKNRKRKLDEFSVIN